MQRGKVVLSGCPQVNFINKNQNIVFTFMKTIKIFLLVFRFALLMNQICTGLENIPFKLQLQLKIGS